MKYKHYLLSSLFFLFTPLTYADAFFDWSQNNIQFLTGNTYNLGSKQRNSITIEHADGWRYGENFAFIDIIDRSDTGTEYYGEFYPRLSLKKVTGKQTSLTFINDFSLVSGINVGNLPKSDPFKAYLLGAGVAFNIPKMNYFTIDILAFKNDSLHTTGLQISPVWEVPFQLGSLHFTFKGFMDWQSKKATGGENVILAQPQLLLDIGQLTGHADQVYMGVEYSYWHNKFGIDKLTERVAKAMVMIKF